ncbi:UDP-xylose and UDP-N-acetylglucosamine transporter-like, partial [Pollicipes pollicipes]|uniref:UDP-xylose and UDP-N-acetylglucosamine transporter-like n=1 Tax=Pollicipes pollicipes TaxID=41117 RepID=UPI0018855503
MQPTLAIVLVLLGCCSNVVFLELLTTAHPGSGNIITFSQFLFIAVHGFVFTMKCGTVRSAIPVSKYFLMVGLFFVVSVINNYALNFGIPMPLHMIFKAGSLVANLLMGMVVLGRYYPLHKNAAVVAISAGIGLCTYASRGGAAEPGADGGPDSTVTMTIGVALLTSALLLSARLGIYQEVLYTTFGKHSQQALFFTHALPLPGFLLLASDIGHHTALFSASEPLALPLLPVPVPRLWFFLACNVVTQYVCISSVFRLTEQCTSLTVTLVITLRKFASLLFSI